MAPTHIQPYRVVEEGSYIRGNKIHKTAHKPELSRLPQNIRVDPKHSQWHVRVGDTLNLMTEEEGDVMSQFCPSARMNCTNRVNYRAGGRKRRGGKGKKLKKKLGTARKSAHFIVSQPQNRNTPGPITFSPPLQGCVCVEGDPGNIDRARPTGC